MKVVRKALGSHVVRILAVNSLEDYQAIEELES